jgi:hypothetical protein
MMKRNNPGCPCCEETCNFASFDFGSAGQLDSFTEVSGDWDVSGGQLTTSDANAVIRLTTAPANTKYRATAIATLADTGDSLTLRIGWDTSAGSYLWAKWIAGTYDGTNPDLSYVGTLEIGSYTTGGGSVTLQGPWRIEGGQIESQRALIACYDGEKFTASLGAGAGAFDSRQTLTALAGTDFTHPGGAAVGLATGQASDYAVDSLTIDYRNGESEEEPPCPPCDSCTQEDGLGGPYYEGTPPPYSISRLWEVDASGWAAAGGGKILESTTDEARLWWRGDFVSFGQQRRISFDFDTDGDEDWFWIYFWWEDWDNFFAIEYYEDYLTLWKAAGGSYTSYGSVPKAVSAGTNTPQNYLYLRKDRAVLRTVSFDGGNARSVSEAFANEIAPASGAIGIESYYVTPTTGKIAMTRWLDGCGEVYPATCGACSETPESEDLPERMEIAIAGNTIDDRINGTYVAELEYGPAGYDNYLAPNTTYACVYRVRNMPSGFEDMVLWIQREGPGSIVRRFQFYARHADRQTPVTPSCGGTRWTYTDANDAEPLELPTFCEVLDGHSLAPVSSLDGTPSGPMSGECTGKNWEYGTATDNADSGTCVVTAMENLP